MSVLTLERRFAATHPAAEGHFPGDPIIPGAVLLSDTLSAIADHLGIILHPCEIRSAKFFRPVRPGETLRIEFSPTAGQIKFVCRVEANTVLSGQVACAGL
jgi:3-hydroxyacyl-[acyl-carrier-protein] dehydratase